jgi:hypothetical protein
MCKMLRNHVVLFVLTVICWCNQATCTFGPLTPQDIADINALLPGLAIPGQGLWTAVRSNPPKRNLTETLVIHYESEHGKKGTHNKTLPFFYGARVVPIAGPNPATAEEVVMANFIATLLISPVPGVPPVPVLPAETLVRVNANHSREIRIPVSGKYGIRIQKGVLEPIDANFCSIFLPEVLPLPAGAPPGALAPPPANICTIYFRQ